MRDATIGRLADDQHGVVSQRQLLCAGLTDDVVQNALNAGRLRRLHRGVYAVGHTALQRQGHWKAALLAAGDGAALAERSSGQLWLLRRGELEPITLIVPGQGGAKREGITAHRWGLDDRDWMLVDGLRVTTPARTIVDLSRTLCPRDRRLLIERAQDLNRFNAREIRRVLERLPRCPGRRPLTAFLDLLEARPDGTTSHLERLFLAIVKKARLPIPECNPRTLGRRRDFVWPEQRLVVEVDGYAYHSSREAMRQDKRRDRELLAHDWKPARFTYEDVAFEPLAVAGELPGLLARVRDQLQAA